MKTILMFSMILFCSTCFANNANEEENYDELISTIVANQTACVLHVENEKIYIRPDRIFPSEQGLYLNLNDDEYISLPYLGSDHQGCYLVKRGNIDIFNKCPSCGYEYFVTCKRPECPQNIEKQQKREEEKQEKERRKQEKKERKNKKE